MPQGYSIVRGGKDTSSVLWLPAADLKTATIGTPSLAVLPGGYFNHWLLDASTAEAVNAEIDGDVFGDLGWATFDAVAVVDNAGAGSGDVVLRLDRQIWAVGSSMSGGTGGTARTHTVGAQNVRQEVTMDTGITVPTASQSIGLRMQRIAGDAADTLANDLGLVGLLLTKAS